MGYKFLLEALKTWKMPHPQSERLEKNAMDSMQTTASRRREAAMLSDEQLAEMMRETWGCASIAPRHALEFARAVERAHGIKGGQHGTDA